MVRGCEVRCGRVGSGDKVGGDRLGWSELLVGAFALQTDKKCFENLS